MWVFIKIIFIRLYHCTYMRGNVFSDYLTLEPAIDGTPDSSIYFMKILLSKSKSNDQKLVKNWAQQILYISYKFAMKWLIYIQNISITPPVLYQCCTVSAVYIYYMIYIYNKWIENMDMLRLPTCFNIATNIATCFNIVIKIISELSLYTIQCDR